MPGFVNENPLMTTLFAVMFIALTVDSGPERSVELAFAPATPACAPLIVSAFEIETFYGYVPGATSIVSPDVASLTAA